jgi:hypothetical protein
MVAPTSDRRPRWAVLLGLRDVGHGRPARFFEAAAAFEPYNQHFVQDIGAFQIGLSAVLLLSAFLAGADGLTTGLLGVAVGSAAHVISHVVGRDLGGTPEVDIPVFAVMTLLLLAGGLDSWRRLPGSPRRGDRRRPPISLALSEPAPSGRGPCSRRPLAERRERGR